MNSLKNSIVAILLLGVSFGVYQVITSPDANLQRSTAGLKVDELSIEVPSSSTDMHQVQSERGVDSGNHPLVVPAPRSFETRVERQEGIESRPPMPPPLIDSPMSGGSDFSAAPPSPPPAAHSFDAPANSLSPATAPPGGIEPRQPMSELGPVSPRGSGESFSSTGFEPPPSANAVNPPPAGLNPPAFSAGATPPSATASPTALAPLESQWAVVRQQVDREEFRAALANLTPYLRDRALDPQQRQQLLTWLDALAFKVIYSTEHHFAAMPYTIRPEDTLESIGREWGVPPQLVYNINSQKIDDPLTLQPGTELKKVAGPLRAELDVNQRWLTLYMEDCYAGRFEVAGEIPAQWMPGDYRVRQKQAAGHAAGSYVVELDREGMLWRAVSAGAAPAAGLSFSAKDAQDIFGILSVGSQITILGSANGQ